METERAYAMAKELGRKDGLLVGVSAAGAVATSLQIAEQEARAGREQSSSPSSAIPRQVSQRALLAGGVTAMLKLSYADYQALRAHGEETYPHEVLRRSAGQRRADGIRSAALCAPQYPQRPRPRPLQHRPGRAHPHPARGSGLGLDIVGFYHSHPDVRRSGRRRTSTSPLVGCSYIITRVDKPARR